VCKARFKEEVQESGIMRGDTAFSGGTMGGGGGRALSEGI